MYNVITDYTKQCNNVNYELCVAIILKIVVVGFHRGLIDGS